MLVTIQLGLRWRSFANKCQAFRLITLQLPKLNSPYKCLLLSLLTICILQGAYFN